MKVAIEKPISSIADFETKPLSIYYPNWCASIAKCRCVMNHAGGKLRV